MTVGVEFRDGVNAEMLSPQRNEKDRRLELEDSVYGIDKKTFKKRLELMYKNTTKAWTGFDESLP